MSLAKVNAFSVGPYNGRDKLAKVMQFSAKFVAYHLLLSNPKDDFADKLQKFDKTIAISRKGLRLFKSVELYQKLIIAMGKDMSQADFALEVITNVGMMFRWAYDNLSFLEKAKIIQPMSYGVTSNKYRVVSTFAYIVMGLKKFSNASSQIATAAKAGKQEALQKAQKAQKEALLEVIGRVADQVNALHSAKWYQTNDGIQGIAGVISALVALRKVWNAIK